MIIELGHFLLISATVMTMIQVALSFYYTKAQKPYLRETANVFLRLIFFFLILSFSTLVYAFIMSDFSVLIVAENSDRFLSLWYRIIAVWSNHEGSIFLWVVILSFYGFLFTFVRFDFSDRYYMTVIGIQTFILFLFLLFVLFFANPFIRIIIPPYQGLGLNPSLQDLSLGIHPPLLYLGYIGFSVCFSHAVGALIIGKLEPNWASSVRFWALLSWLLLTLGILFGSYWAYYELGWGGFWYWDPVENAALSPWLCGLSLLHCIQALEKKHLFKTWTLFIAILTFSFSLFGSFLVRSGMIDSVHSFVFDPRRGTVLLILLFLLCGGSFLLFAVRASMFSSKEIKIVVSKEGALLFNNLFLITVVSVIFLATIYPVVLRCITGEEVFLSPSFFNRLLFIIIVPFFLAIPIGLQLDWNKNNLGISLINLRGPFFLSLAVALSVLSRSKGNTFKPSFGIWLAIWIILGSFTCFWKNLDRNEIEFWKRLKKFKKISIKGCGTTFAHIGAGVFLLGVVCSSNFGQYKVKELNLGESVYLAGRYFKLSRIDFENKIDSKKINLIFEIFDAHTNLGRVKISRDFMVLQNTSVLKTGQFTIGLSQYYLAPGQTLKENSVLIYFYWKPLVLCIWLGGFFFALGAAFCLGGYAVARLKKK